MVCFVFKKVSLWVLVGLGLEVSLRARGWAG